jgi:hypothetical protein
MGNGDNRRSWKMKRKKSQTKLKTRIKNRIAAAAKVATKKPAPAASKKK